MNKMTPHRQRILQLYAGGLTYYDISRVLKIKPQTIKNTLHTIYDIYGVTTKVQAVIEGIRRGDIDLEYTYQCIIARRRQYN